MKRIALVLVTLTITLVAFGQKQDAPIKKIVIVNQPHDAPSYDGAGGYISTGNFGGTGNAAYFPSGIWTKGSNSWLYGDIRFGYGSLFDNEASTPRWKINPAGNSWFNGGNVGIGTTTPYGKLHVFSQNSPAQYYDGELQVGGFIGTSEDVTLIIGTHYTKKTTFLQGWRAGFGPTPILLQPQGGNVGIGTTNPTGTLTVYKSEYPLFEVSNSLQKLQISVANNAWDGAPGFNPGDVVFRPLGVSSSPDYHGMIMYLPNDNNDGLSYIKFGDSKNKLWVGIFNNRIFRVDGLFIANEIKVKVDVWSDYVLDKSYNLPTLKSVEEFININGHLPEVPSEKQVKEDGINVSEMNATLLKKIEEITLYVIELDKKVKNLEEQNSELKKSIEGLKH